ncbi:D-allulose 6-phosphate 3-epimerase [Marasmitruncus massiliensis]|uniref:D-allulose 6-phosphate 3-epimerase n=1 Tax=Marasmitruncus massiliensis TaxID=1944642 RepID=UPI000C7A4293|nr:D-allulose 6-phosphate 3-epimerase [Marasmitruncus massiliensis]MBE6906898.1 ribulose-phosphate 3-epimerase [Oscillospiraceae bacterium]
MKPEFSVSLMCMDFLDIKNQLEILNKRADMYHIDIMDGHFCKNITLSPDFIRAAGRAAKLPMDVHLMTENPNDWLEPVAKAGATYIAPHAETINTDAFRVLARIKELGCKAGVVLNPATPLQAIEHYMGRLDMITIMTVDVGYAGQPFIPEMLDKIAQAKRLREKKGYNYKIQIDGSCNVKTFGRLREAGADVFILGSSGLFGLDADLNTAYDKMLMQYQAETKEEMQV